MKTFITPTYTFTPGISGVGTVDLSGISGFNIKYLVSIINQTRGVVIYSTASAALRYTNVAGTVVTLFANTSAMSSGNVLQVIYEDFSAIQVSQPDLLLTGQSAQTAVINNILPATASASASDFSGYRSGSVQIISTGTAGTFIFEQSNDNVNFQPLTVFNSALINGAAINAAITASASQIIYSFPIRSRFIRLRIATLITGGSIQAFTRVSQESWAPAVMTTAQGTAANLNMTASIAAAQTLATVTTVETVTTLANGQTAHSAASTGSPVRVAGRVVTALDTTLAAGDASDLLITTGQQLVVKGFATSENDWQFTGALTTTTPVAARAAGAASIRNFVTGFTFQNTSAIATTVLVLDGATTIAQFNASASMVAPAAITFPTPLRGTAATALNLNCGTAAANVLVNIQGYQSF